jgi:hypothetical protein
VKAGVEVMVGVAVGLGFNGLLGPINQTTNTAAPMITIITVSNISMEELLGPRLLRR